MNKYSILIPIHNESNYVPILLKELRPYYDKGNEIIIIDDGSTDDSNAILKKTKFIKLIEIKNNSGKGYAIKEGLKNVSHHKIIIFDGDIEIHPSEISKLMILNSKNKTRCVMGHRFESLKPVKSNFDWGNFIFTSFFNILFNSYSKDILCCAKAFYIEDLKNYRLNSNGFDIDVELSTYFWILLKKRKISKILLNYNRRTKEEGKKLQVIDGWKILSRLIKMIKYI
tara:strand:+ start:420 stop:1100 length:681 start_codon:yes stop_codon:yes gene_type:complete